MKSHGGMSQGGQAASDGLEPDPVQEATLTELQGLTHRDACILRGNARACEVGYFPCATKATA